MATIVPRLSISTETRIRVGERQVWRVHGMCEPENTFDSLAAARLYCRREAGKLRGGHLPPWIPTHTITHPKRRIHVRMVEGAYFTQGEWDHCTQPDWETRTDGRLYFQGARMGARWSVVPFVKYTDAFAAPLLTAFGTGWAGLTLIQRIAPYPVLVASGTQIRISVWASPVGAALIDRIYISQADPTPSANPWDSDVDLTRVWDSTDQGILTVLANENFPVPDAIYNLQRSRPLIIAIDFANFATAIRYSAARAAPGVRTFIRPGAQAAIRKRSADYQEETNGRTWFISRLEAGVIPRAR